MLIRDIIEGYVVLRELKRQGYVEEDGLGLKEIIKLAFNAEKNMKNIGVEANEDKQG